LGLSTRPIAIDAFRIIGINNNIKRKEARGDIKNKVFISLI
jgi:hypothetical protein